MIDKVKALALILSRMNVLYERVLSLLEHERKQLVRLDYENLYISFREKDELLAAIRGLDRDRLRIQDQFAIVMGKRTEDLTLKILALALIEQDPISAVEGRRLLLLRDQLEVTVGRMKDRIKMNNTFIESSVSNLRGIAEVVTHAVQGTSPSRRRPSATYNGRAALQQRAQPTGKILEKRL